jgi:hypothetical protein
MEVLRSMHFLSGNELTEFVEKNGIRRENIISIVQTPPRGYTLFYYTLP